MIEVTKDKHDAWSYFTLTTDHKRHEHRRYSDGRAVLKYHQTPDETGNPQAQLWLCRLRNVLVACDDTGAFVVVVKRDETNGDVVLKWKQSRVSVLAQRADERRYGLRRRKARHQKHITHGRAA